MKADTWKVTWLVLVQRWVISGSRLFCHLNPTPTFNREKSIEHLEYNGKKSEKYYTKRDITHFW